ncbi:hypothetical protein BurJ1DRAFT_4883 [Burkholderiales bacterium JOSHI_001]|nr:hypothetical protein BurJ1DRAFT_4883 [Burkholderiales bacterium JOSHI_001]
MFAVPAHRAALRLQPMPLNPDTDDGPLSPAWTAAAAAVAALLGWWPCHLLHQELWVRQAGAGGFILAIYAPIAFFVVYIVSLFPLIWLLRRQRSLRARGALCLLPAGVVLAVNGLPGLFGLAWVLLMAAGVYVDTARRQADGRDLKVFLAGNKRIAYSALADVPYGHQATLDRPITDKLAVNTPLIGQPRPGPVAKGLVKGYDKPLWDRLECENPEPLSVTEGLEDGHHYTVMDLRHVGFGLRGDNGATVVTTFFIVAIPEAVKGRVVTWQPPGWDVSVDVGFVYMAKPQKQVRPGEWRGLIQQTIKVLESLKTRDAAGDQVRAPTYRPRGHGVALNLFNAAACLLVGGLLIGFGLANMVGLVDYRTHCLRGSTEARCLDTQHGYSVPGALIEGGKFALAGAFLLWCAHHSRTQARRRQRNDAQQQADL